MVKIETLKELYKANRRLREREERHLKIIDRLHNQILEEEEELCSGSPFDEMFSGFKF
jgi:hypothetical protein